MHLGLQAQIGDQFLSGLHLPRPRLEHLSLEVGTGVGEGLPGSPGIFVLPGTADSSGLETGGRAGTTGTTTTATTVQTRKFGGWSNLAVITSSGSLLAQTDRAGLPALDDGH